MRSTPKKKRRLPSSTVRITCRAALKGNQGNLYKSVQEKFVAEESYVELNIGHGRLEKRRISICTQIDQVNPWPGLRTL